MRRSRGTVFALAVLLGTGLVAAVQAADRSVLVVGDLHPAILDVVGTDELLALALGPEGDSAAAAYADPRDPGRTKLRVYSNAHDPPHEATLPGIVRSLIFSPAGDEVLVILHKPAKKRQGDSTLVRVDLAKAKPRSIMRLPATSAGLAYSAQRESLLVAASDEIRTIRVDGWRSGPLFRVTGSNLSLAALPGTDAVLVGQDEGVILVNLADRPGEEGLPVRDRAALPSTVDELAVEPDAKSVLARLGDGRVYRVWLGSLLVDPQGSTDVLVASPVVSAAAVVGLPPPVVPPVSAEAASPSEAPEAATTAGAAAPETVATGPDIQPERSAQAEVEHAASPEQPAPASALETPETQPAVSAPPAGEPQTPPPPPEKTSPKGAGSNPQLWGRLDGEAAGDVLWVVLLGPDNIVNEARRVRPETDGSWRVDGLAPGRYQIQLAGGSDAMLVCEPRVAVVEVTPDGSVQAPDMRVLRAFRP